MTRFLCWVGALSLLVYVVTRLICAAVGTVLP